MKNKIVFISHPPTQPKKSCFKAHKIDLLCSREWRQRWENTTEAHCLQLAGTKQNFNSYNSTRCQHRSLSQRIQNRTSTHHLACWIQNKTLTRHVANGKLKLNYRVNTEQISTRHLASWIQNKTLAQRLDNCKLKVNNRVDTEQNLNTSSY
jgi:hypothetical protein